MNSYQRSYTRVGSTSNFNKAKIIMKGIAYLAAAAKFLRPEQLIEFDDDSLCNSVYMKLFDNTLDRGSLSEEQAGELADRISDLNMSQLILLDRILQPNGPQNLSKNHYLAVLIKRVHCRLSGLVAASLLSLPIDYDVETSWMQSIGRKFLEAIGIIAGIVDKFTNREFTWVVHLLSDDAKKLLKLRSEMGFEDEKLSRYLYLDFPSLQISFLHPSNREIIPSALFSHELIYVYGKGNTVKVNIYKYSPDTRDFKMDGTETSHKNMISELISLVSRPNLKHVEREHRPKPLEEVPLFLNVKNSLRSVSTPARSLVPKTELADWQKRDKQENSLSYIITESNLLSE